jgi:TRAP-type C4-dicarboxylate transport system substrate-binding protein
MKKNHVIRWVLYHEPVHLFIRTAKSFSNEIQKLTDGRISVEIYTLEEYADKFKNGVYHEPMALIQNDDIEMSQMQTNHIAIWGNPDFNALEMPYLFKDHEHATRVLDGQIGRQLLDSLQERTPVNGLAFTYSGGYRVMASDKELNSIDDFIGVNLITTPNPVMVETAKTLGCEPLPYYALDYVSKQSALSKPNHILETTLPRYETEANTDVQKFIIDTSHSMYLTSILISKKLWSELDSEDQGFIRQAARHAAVQERIESVEEADEYAVNVQRHRELGVTYKKLDDTEISKMKEIVKPLYDKYEDLFSPGLLNGIIKA